MYTLIKGLINCQVSFICKAYLQLVNQFHFISTANLIHDCQHIKAKV